MEFEHGAPFFLLIASVLVIVPLLLASFGLLPGARIDLTRSVVVHTRRDRVWEFVGRLPALHEGHGRIKDFGCVTEWSLRHGDGASAGSVWRALGTWRAGHYWADLEILRIDPGREIAVRLRRDSLATQKGLRDHTGSLSLESIGPNATKITWRLEARLRGPRLLLARLLSSQSLRARLLDQGLRSLKVEIDTAAAEREDNAEASENHADPLDVPPSPGPAPPETTV